MNPGLCGIKEKKVLHLHVSALYNITILTMPEKMLCMMLVKLKRCLVMVSLVDIFREKL